MLIKLMKYNWVIFFMIIMPFVFLNMMNFFSLWIIMEFNLMLFILYLIMENDELSDELFLYFLMNSFSSIFFMLFFMMSLFYEDYLFQMVLNMMMFMKLGIFPFYYVIILLLDKLSWLSCFYLLLLQKLIPLMFLMQLINNKFINYMLLMLNGLISVILCYNEMSLKNIMGYSSMNNVSWMLLMLMFSENLFLYYYMIYYLMNYIMMLYFYKVDMNMCLDFMILMKNKLMIMFQFLVMGGLPPFWGFLMKMCSLMWLMQENLFFIMLILVFYSLIFLYYYFRFMIFYLMMNFNIINNLKIFYYNMFFYKNIYFYMNLFLMFYCLLWCFLL